MNLKNKKTYFIVLILIIVFIIIFTNQSLAYDSAGIQINPDDNFFLSNYKNINELSWKAEIREYGINYYPSSYPVSSWHDYIALRFDYNCVTLMNKAETDTMNICFALQNVMHNYNNDACSYPSNTPGGMELYFSLQDGRESQKNIVMGGVKLDANPDSYPKFRRIFQDIDGLGMVGNNIYANEIIGVPSPSNPITIEWKLIRGNIITNPSGNLRKNLDCQWEPLIGEFREWIASVSINGKHYNVGTFYTLTDYGYYFHPRTPLILNQEMVGACGQYLDVNTVDVTYYDFKLQDTSLNTYNIPKWKIKWPLPQQCSDAPCPISPDTRCNSNELKTADNRYGIQIQGINGKKGLNIRYGHEEDTNLKREINYIFEGIDEQADYYTASPNIPEGAVIRAKDGIDVYIIKYVGSKNLNVLSLVHLYLIIMLI